MRRIAVVTALAAIALPAQLRAQDGLNGAILLELPASTRALALGNTFVAAGADEAAIFYNPAQLAAAPHIAAGLSVQQYLASSTLAAAAFATHVWHGTVGLGLQVLDYGSSEEIVDNPSLGGGGMPTGATISAADYALSLAYAVRVGPARLGATGKYVAQRLVNESAGTGAMDFGVALDVKGATIGAALQHVGGELVFGNESSPLPRTVRVGAAVPVHNIGRFDILGTVEVSHTRRGETKPSGGVELAYQATNGVSLLGRVGAIARPAGSLISPVSFGGGVRARHLAVDYAYEGFDVFGATHRVGVRWWR